MFKSFVVLCVVAFAACASAGTKAAAPKSPATNPIYDPKVMNPLCPNKLSSDKARYKCYSRTIRRLYEGVYNVNLKDLWVSANVFMPWMTPDIKGRTSAGAFTGVDLNAEYLAVGVPALQTFGDRIDPPKITYFVTAGHVAAFSGDFLRHGQGNRTANWTLWGFARFTPNTNRMSHYDVDFRRYPEMLKALGSIGQSEAALKRQQAFLAQFICNITMRDCVGKNQQYDNWQACYDYNVVNTLVPYPDGQVNGNCHLCRTVHTFLMPFDKDLHCWHLGPSGPRNGACSGPAYSEYYKFFGDSDFISHPGLMS